MTTGPEIFHTKKQFIQNLSAIFNVVRPTFTTSRQHTLHRHFIYDTMMTIHVVMALVAVANVPFAVAVVVDSSAFD